MSLRIFDPNAPRTTQSEVFTDGDGINLPQWTPDTIRCSDIKTILELLFFDENTRERRFPAARLDFIIRREPDGYFLAELREYNPEGYKFYTGKRKNSTPIKIFKRRISAEGVSEIVGFTEKYKPSSDPILRCLIQLRLRTTIDDDEVLS